MVKYTRITKLNLSLKFVHKEHFMNLAIAREVIWFLKDIMNSTNYIKFFWGLNLGSVLVKKYQKIKQGYKKQE